jgi:transketolase
LQLLPCCEMIRKLRFAAIILDMADIAQLKDIASQLRRDIVRMVHAVQSGHPGGSLGCADFFTALYFSVMKHHPKFSMNGKNEDMFFLSNGHISPIFYSTLARAGYFDVKELSSFRKINSRLQGHPATHEHLPGSTNCQWIFRTGYECSHWCSFSKKVKWR